MNITPEERQEHGRRADSFPPDQLVYSLTSVELIKRDALRSGDRRMNTDEPTPLITCPICGPGYIYGSDGCHHVPPKVRADTVQAPSLTPIMNRLAAAEAALAKVEEVCRIWEGDVVSHSPEAYHVVTEILEALCGGK